MLRQEHILESLNLFSPRDSLAKKCFRGAEFSCINKLVCLFFCLSGIEIPEEMCLGGLWPNFFYFGRYSIFKKNGDIMILKILSVTHGLVI